MDAVMSAVPWRAVPPPETVDELPYVVMEGELELMGHTFRCYQLSSGDRVFNAEDLETFLGLLHDETEA